MFSFLDAKNVPLAAGSDGRRQAVRPRGRPDEGRRPGPATFIWAIEPRVGVYVDVDLPTSGDYGVEFVTTPAGGTAETIRTTMQVQPSSEVISVGDKAPSSKTPTLAQVDGDVTMISDRSRSRSRCSTRRPSPTRSPQKEPFVLVFATPKFCATKQCGPTPDRLKPIMAKHPDLTVINVEPYQLEEVDG